MSVSGDDATTALERPGSLVTPPGSGGEGNDAVAPGTRIGRYLVIEELGRGGMGLVLRAYDPKLQREVALKRLRTAVLDADARARLIAEARAMARLAHPNVVAVYDVELEGESGVVLVMEYVAGTTLTRWLEAAGRRPWQEIVDAFVAAGRGLAAAHTEGLLHRDFKPANVLVGSDGRVRVTDFGLARTSGQSTDEPREPPHASTDSRDFDGVAVPLTEEGMVMGTPPYMAPEQHETRPLDARVDQYALCIALWRALCGDWPFDGHGAALVVGKLAGPPKWPSGVRVPRHVAEAIRRGLSPRPSQRWSGMDDLLAELERDPSRRRQRWLAVGGVVLVGAGTLGWQRIERSRAIEACAAEGAVIDETWNPARVDAIATAFEQTGVGYAADAWTRARARLGDYAEAWQQTRVTVCRGADVEQTVRPEVVAGSRACLDEHRVRLDALLAQLSRPDPGVVQRAGTASAWLPQLTECTDEGRLRLRPLGSEDEAAQERIVALGSRLSAASAARVTGRYDESLEVAQSAVSEADQLGSTPLVAEAKLETSRVLEAMGNAEEARALLEEAFMAAGAAGRDDLALEVAILQVFVLGSRLGRHDEALHWGRLAQMVADRLGRQDDIAVAGLYDGLGNVYTSQGKYDEALELHRRALAIQESILGPQHPQVAVSLNSLGSAHHGRGEPEEARAYYERSLAIREEVFGPDHPHVAGSLNNLGNTYRNLGDDETALALQRRGLEIMERAFGEDSPRIVALRNNLGEIHRLRGEYEEALVEYQAALGIMERAFGPEHRDVALLLDNIGLTHRALGALDDARTEFERAIAIRTKALGADHPDLALSLHNLGEVLLEQGDPGRALEVLEPALEIRDKAEVPPTELARTRFAVARAQWDAGRDRERARALAEAALEAPPDDDAAAVEAWLATHPQPSRP